MQPVTLDAVILAGLAIASPGNSVGSPSACPGAAPTDVTRSLNASDFAEIYIIPPWISFVAAPTPSTVRLSGCKYFVSRHAVKGDRPEWMDLEGALKGMEFEPAPSARRRQVYYGLVLGDEKGTVREIYTDHMSDPPGKVLALDARRQVHIPERFAEALFAFAARHPELAQGPPGRCPSLDVSWPANR
jgi:hypothetical protein